MKDSKKLNEVQQKLQEGKLSKALELLLETIQKDRTTTKELLALQSDFEYYRNQYEVKGLLSGKDFNAYYLITLIGVQDILKKLQARRLKSEKTKILQRVLFVASLVTLIGIGVFWLNPSFSEKKEKKPEQLEQLKTKSTHSKPVATLPRA